jgi:hypothetical protein
MPLSAIAAVPLLASLVLSYRASPDRVYIVADSRLTSTSAAQTSLTQLPHQPLLTHSNDSACKIRILNGGVVFVGTGNTLFTASGHTTNIYTVAANAALTLAHRPLQATDLRHIALVWQATIHARLQAKLNAATPVLQAEPVTGTTGSFYAVTAGGNVSAITLRIAPGPGGRLQNIEEPQSPPGYLVATGTDAAKQDALELADSQQNATLPWPYRLQAIEAQTIREEEQRYGNLSEIGGPVDLIEISSKGPAWLTRKSSCPGP